MVSVSYPNFSLVCYSSFFWSFSSGENLQAGSPILVLRNTLLKRSKARVITRDERKAPMVILAWNLMRKNPDATINGPQRILWHGRIGQGYPTIQ
jgi:hypothetical protein